MKKLLFKVRYMLFIVGVLSCAQAVMCMQLQLHGIDERRAQLANLVAQRDIVVNRLNRLAAAHTYVARGGQGLRGQQVPNPVAIQQGIAFAGALLAVVERHKSRVAFEYLLLRDGKVETEITPQERGFYSDEAEGM